MNEARLFELITWAYLALAPLVFVLLLVVPAPYGRYTRAGFGPTLDRRLGWVLMEAPSPLLVLGLFVLGDRQGNLVALLFVLLWLSHYLHRAFLFPFQMRGGARQMTWAAALLGFAFNCGNGYLNGRFVAQLGPERGLAWLADPRFVAGVVLFALGYAINRHADLVLHRLRAPGETGYKIPHGGLYRWISCPNYLGEIVEWSGWALATWSLPGLAFAAFTAANLAPRALAHHRWYRAHFADYPPERRALIPFVV